MPLTRSNSKGSIKTAVDDGPASAQLTAPLHDNVVLNASGALMQSFGAENRSRLQREIDTLRAEKQALETDVQQQAQTIQGFVAEVERMHKLIEKYQLREKPKETFKDCVGELKAVQQAKRQTASVQAALEAAQRQVQAMTSEHRDAVLALQAANTKALREFTLKAQRNLEGVRREAEASESALRERCAELQQALERAQQEAFSERTQRMARERELRCALRANEPAGEQHQEQQPAGEGTAASEGDAAPAGAQRRASFIRRQTSLGASAGRAPKRSKDAVEPAEEDVEAPSRKAKRADSFIRAPKRFKRATSFGRSSGQTCSE